MTGLPPIGNRYALLFAVLLAPGIILPGCLVAGACTPLGDVNCDGEVDFADINGFVLAITEREQYELLAPPDCAWRENWDFDGDRQPGFGDIDGFIDVLVLGICPPNRAPIAVSMYWELTEETPASFQLVGYDPDGGRGCP